MSSGSLPRGLSLNSSTGRIVGTPNQSVTNYQVTIVVENVANRKSVHLSFTVILPLTAFRYSSSEFSLPRLQSVSVSPIITGFAQSFSVLNGTLPSGLQLNGNTGVISGIPSSMVFDKLVTVKAENALGFKTTTVAFTILLPITSFSYPNSVYNLPKNKPVFLSPSTTGDSVTYSLSGALPLGLSFITANGTISGTPSQTVINQSVSVKAENGLGSMTALLTFSVVASITSFSYSPNAFVIARNEVFSIAASTDAEVPTFSVSSGTLPQGLSLNPTTGSIVGTPSQSVSNSLVGIKVANAVSYKTTSLTFTVVLPLTSFTYPQSTNVIPKSKEFSLSPSVIGDIASISITNGSLPSGLQLNEHTGLITGTPFTTVYNHAATVRAENELGFKTTTITFTVLEQIASFSYPLSQYVLTRNQRISIVPTFTGDSVTFSISHGSLPTGLSLNTLDGTISGTPSDSILSPITITVTATNSIGSKSTSLTIRVLTKPMAFYYSDAVFLFSVNDPVSIVPTAEGDLIEYSLQGSLPEGLQLDKETGIISGTAIVATKQAIVTIVASNEVGTLSCSIILRILTPITFLRYPKTQYALVKGNEYSLLPSCDGDELSFSISGGALPNGLTVNNATGVIEGVPSELQGNTQVTIRVSNDINAIETTLNMNVLPLPAILLVLILIIIISLSVAAIAMIVHHSNKRKRLPIRNKKWLKSVPSNIDVVAPVRVFDI